ncbi:hypothetical protein [Lysobacter sp. CA199]|uniref:hypothetical protein n=1 Tax=Lysobacter sp. CA199 TaxID=3455608 RepID=UPI003F8D3EA8
MGALTFSRNPRKIVLNEINRRRKNEYKHNRDGRLADGQRAGAAAKEMGYVEGALRDALETLELVRDRGDLPPHVRGRVLSAIADLVGAP